MFVDEAGEDAGHSPAFVILLSVTGATVLSAKLETWPPAEFQTRAKRWCRVVIGSVTPQAWLADPETMIMMSRSCSASARIQEEASAASAACVLNSQDQAEQTSAVRRHHLVQIISFPV